MANQDWLITNDGDCLAMATIPPTQKLPSSYRLYRFLTDLENILAEVPDDRSRLDLIRPLVRHLLVSAQWLQMNFSLPDPATGWSVVMLYDEPDFEITIQNVAWAGGSISPIHSHGAWGIVALLDGQEKNTLWQRSPTITHPGQIQKTGEVMLQPGDILSLLPNAIHQVEALGAEPTISFNLYGKTDYDQRFEFDLDRHEAQVF
jgi:predicted metal-dependent enzyme (double-stranded beta helix superfamily)